MKSFNRAAGSYGKQAEVQKNAARKLIEALEKTWVKAPNCKLLELGCGTGRDCGQLQTLLLPERYDAVDAAPLMLEKARQHHQHCREIQFHCLNFNSELDRLAYYYDVIFANMALQWTQHFEKLMIQLYHKLAQGGKLYFTLPLSGTFKEISADFRVNTFYTHQEVIQCVNQVGFQQIIAEQYAEVLAFPLRKMQLAHIKASGADCYQGQAEIAFAKVRRYLQSKLPGRLTYQIGVYALCRHRT